MDPTLTSAEIRVRGDAEVRCLPDRAVLRVAVEAEAESQAQAYALASQSAADIDAVLDRFDGDVDRRMTAGVIVRPKTRWRKGETVRTGWIAGRTTVVEVTNFGQLGQLVADLASAGASAQHGPAWEVDKTNPSTTRLVALRHWTPSGGRARTPTRSDFAWGRSSGSPSPGFGLAIQVRFRVGTRAHFFQTDAAALEEPMDITPDEITIQETVEACFELMDRGDAPG